MRNLRTLAAGQVIQSRQLIQQIELEESDPPVLVTGLVYVLATLIVLIILWSNLITVQETASAVGKVIPEGDVLAIQNLEGGIVTDIMVKEGQVVEKGEPLVRLSPVAAESELQQLRARLASAEMETERLKALSDGRAPNFEKYVDEFANLKRRQAEIYASEHAKFLSTEKILQAQLQQQQAERDRLRAKIETLNGQIELLTQELGIQQDLSHKGLGARTTLLSVQRQLQSTEGERAESKSLLVRTEAAIAEAKEKLVEARSELSEKSLTRAGELSVEAAQLREEIKARRDQARRTLVTSPVKGIVQSLAVKGVDAVVRPGEIFAEIVPITDRLYVEARVNPKDIGHIAVGQDVDMNITTFDFSTYGSLPGKLIKLSATTFQTKEGEQYYLATIEPLHIWIGNKADHNQLLPGMVAQASIKTGEKSIFKYLMKPVYRGFSHSFSER